MSSRHAAVTSRHCILRPCACHESSVFQRRSEICHLSYLSMRLSPVVIASWRCEEICHLSSLAFLFPIEGARLFIDYRSWISARSSVTTPPWCCGRNRKLDNRWVDLHLVYASQVLLASSLTFTLFCSREPVWIMTLLCTCGFGYCFAILTSWATLSWSCLRMAWWILHRWLGIFEPCFTELINEWVAESINKEINKQITEWIAELIDDWINDESITEKNSTNRS